MDDDLDCDIIEEINNINKGRKGQHSLLQQKLAVDGMFLFNVQHGFGIQFSAQLTEERIKYVGDVSKATIIRWFKFYCEYGELPLDYARLLKCRNWRSAEKRKDESKITSTMWNALATRLDSEPTLYLDEMQDFFKDEYKVTVSISAISKKLKSRGYTNKVIYSKACQAIEIQKHMFIENLETTLKTPEMALFIDESAKDRRAARRKRGWSKKGVEIGNYELFNRDIRYTLIGVADCYGFCPYMCEVVHHKVDGKEESKPVNADRFVEFFEDNVFPHLGNAANRERHSVVIMDNCSIHTDHRIANMIRQKGAILLYSAPYAPDLIPIEFMFKAYKDYLNRFHKQFQLTPTIVHEGALNV